MSAPTFRGCTTCWSCNCTCPPAIRFRATAREHYARIAKLDERDPIARVEGFRLLGLAEWAEQRAAELEVRR